MIKALERKIPIASYDTRRPEAARKSSLTASRLLKAVLVLSQALNLPACGEPYPANGDAGPECLTVDRFDDGNLVSETVRGDWTAIPGSRIISSEGIIRVEGRRASADDFIGVELRIPLGAPADVRDFDTLFADIRVGLVSDPSASISGVLKIEVEGYTRTGSAVSRTEEDFNSGEFLQRHVVFSDPNPGFTIQYLVRVGIYFRPPDDAEYFIEADNIQLCLTGWPPFYS
jgi:hypothetical protein